MENQTFIIEDELKKLPGKPGVYLMHGEKDEIIYDSIFSRAGTGGPRLTRW